jgi:tetratricopeptide (TPR) repeat protein
VKGFQHFLRRLVGAGLYLILLTPLLVWHGFLFPHLTAKVLAFQVLVEIVCAAALALVLLQIRRPARPTKWHATTSSLTIGLALYLIYSVVNAFFGIDPRRSLWGFVDRQDGLILSLHFFAWFALLVWFYSNPRSLAPAEPHGHPAKDKGHSPDRFHPPGLKEPRIISYARFSFWASCAVAVTALMEWISVRYGDSVPLLLQTPFPDRPSGVLGNPMAIGPYLLVHFFFGLYYLVGSARRETPHQHASKNQRRSGSKPQWRPSYLFILILAAELVLLVVILLGQTRGVIFALLGSLFTVAVVFLFKGEGTRRLKFAAVILCLLVLAGGLAVWKFRETDAVRKMPLLERLTRISVTENESTRMRLMVWQSTAKGFRDHPLGGWGHNNVYYVLNRHYDPRHVSFQPDFAESRATWYDKSHNALLEMLVEKGSAGALLFVAVVIAVLINLYKVRDSALCLCLIGALSAYAFSNLVAFDTFGSLFGLYLSLGVLAASTHSKEAMNPEPRKKTDKKPPGELGFARQIGIVAISAGLVLALYVNREIAVVNARSFEAHTVFDQSPAVGEALYQEAFKHLSPYLPREKLNYCYRVVNSLINKRPLGNNSLEQALQGAREAVAAHPFDVAGYMILNEVYNGLGLHVDKKYLDQAEVAGRRALELSPTRQEAIFFLGRTYILRNEPRRAVELNETMVKSHPDFALGHWFLGLSLIADNAQERARAEIKQALQMGYKFRNDEERNVVKQLFGEKAFNELINHQ